MAKTNHTPGSFCWFELGTSDQNAAKKFYPAIFGWDVNDTEMGPDEVYTIFKIKGLDASAAYTLRPDQRSQGVPAHWMPYVAVKSADETASKAQSLGGTVHAPPFDVMDHGRMSVLQDPTGGMFCVWQAIKHQGTGITRENGTAVWADLSTPDQAKAGKFYSDLFGWKMVGEGMKPAKPGEYFHIVNGNDMIGGVQPAEHRPAGVPAHWLLYYQVSDCDGTIAKVKSLGGKVIMPTTKMGDVRQFAVLSDAQGAAFALVQELGGKDTGTEKIKKPAAKRAKPAAKKARKPAAKKARKPAKKASKPAKRSAAKRRPAKKRGKAKK